MEEVATSHGWWMEPLGPEAVYLGVGEAGSFEHRLRGLSWIIGLDP